MSFPARLKRAFSSRSNRDEEEGQELEERNDSGLSARSVRILNDINIGIYPCAVCMDPISFGRGPEYSLWHCKECFNVYHFRCARAWCQSNRSASWASGVPRAVWSCPSCTTEQATITEANCWCGKTAHGNIEPGKSNACGNVCTRAGQCPHGGDKICQEECHPGPCKYACSTRCAQHPILPRREPTAWNRFCKRVREQNRNSNLTWLMKWGWVILAVVYGCLGPLWYFHIRWNTMSYKYPNFDGQWEAFGLFLFGLLAFVGLWTPFMLALYFTASIFHVSAFNLNSVDTKLGRKALVKALGGSFLILMFLVTWALPFVGFAGGPNIAWNMQMKDSCNGLDTRILMDTEKGSRFTANSLVWNSPTRHFYLAGHVDSTAENSEGTFQYYQRLSGSTSHHDSIAIDVDIANRQWRLFSLNRTDEANEWLSYHSKQLQSGGFPKVPNFQAAGEHLLAKGEFTAVDAKHKAMVLPELDLVILGMWGFISRFDQEPFLRVVNTTDYTEADYNNRKLRIVEDGWTSKPHPREIMRTASFGHGRQDLTMCVKENSHTIDPSDVRNGGAENSIDEQPKAGTWGIQTYQLVPFAIISAYRQRVWETKIRHTT